MGKVKELRMKLNFFREVLALFVLVQFCDGSAVRLSRDSVGSLGVPLSMDRLNVAQGFEPVGQAPNILSQAGWGHMDTLNDILQDGRLGDIITNIQNTLQAMRESP